MSEHTMEIEETLEFKNTLTASIPKTEIKKIVHKKEIAQIDKSIPCVCGETQHLKTVECTDGILRNLCRECRKPVTIDIITTALITQVDYELIPSGIKTLELLEVIEDIISEHPIVRVSVQSSALKNKVTKSKAVDIYQRFKLKLTRAEPTLTITGRRW